MEATKILEGSNYIVVNRSHDIANLLEAVFLNNDKSSEIAGIELQASKLVSPDNPYPNIEIHIIPRHTHSDIPGVEPHLVSSILSREPAGAFVEKAKIPADLRALSKGVTLDDLREREMIPEWMGKAVDHFVEAVNNTTILGRIPVQQQVLLTPLKEHMRSIGEAVGASKARFT